MVAETALQTEFEMEQAVASLNALLGIFGRLYMHFTNSVLETSGPDGEMTVRHHLRQFGHFRGTEMREAHHAMGKPINMQTITCFWDNASTYVIHDDMDAGTYTPSDSAFDVHFCPAAIAWKSAGFHRWGHVYCDEFHQACASTYHPDGNVVIPINMMKGDDHCAFRWIMPANARQLDLGDPTALGRKLAATYGQETAEQGALNAMRRTSRLIGGCYLTMVRPLQQRHSPEEAQQILRKFLAAWSRERGELMRAGHQERGIAITPANLVREMDFCAGYIWDMTEEIATDGAYTAVIRDTPFDQAWADYNLGPEAALFWEVTLPALAEGYDPDLRVEVPRLRQRGDDAMEIRVTRIDGVLRPSL
ncbi:MAG: L-2-amino-thiazoline-4-carboxylic acid hydrolase [Thermomicrobiales bacterium]|nr:L-2-amino-thiazoline-4-carboxylic acid hydrolase [Thermomicrobiales bacterium]